MVKNHKHLTERVWLIWSLEHDAWWKPNRTGYTPDIEGAGRYYYKDAIQIVRDANEYTGGTPYEAMVLDHNLAK